MTLHDKFERIVVLNLPYREDRKKRLMEHFQETNIACPDKVQFATTISGDWVRPPAWWNAGNGAWGCCMSHTYAIATAIMDKVDSLLVLEDDVVFSSNATEELQEIAAEWPATWGQIYLGGQHLKDRKSVSKHWVRAKNINRTHAYAVHNSAMGKMVAHCLHAPDYMKHKGWHIDHQLGIAHERGDWPVFAPKWWLAGQAADSSNISGRPNRELWWQPIRVGYAAPLLLRPPDLKNTDPEYLNFCHSGNSLYRDTCEDVGADKALKQQGGLHPFLTSIANEAIWNHRVPAVQHAGFTKESIGSAWKGKILTPERRQIAKIHSDLMKNLHKDTLK